MEPRDTEVSYDTAARDVPPLEMAMNYQRNAIVDLGGELRLLRTQLAPLVQPTIPEADDRASLRASDPSPPRSPHVADLYEQNERVIELVEMVRQLRAYLDVQ